MHQRSLGHDKVHKTKYPLRGLAQHV